MTQPQQTQVLTSATAAGLRKMLKEVVVSGTGRRAQLDGYSAAGKTGTAWKVNPKTKAVDASLYVSSFIGMAPADDPEIVIAVVMDEPKGGARDGGVVSAPVFREIAQQILQTMKIPRDMPRKTDTTVAEVIPETPGPETPSETTVSENIEPQPKPKPSNKPATDSEKPKTPVKKNVEKKASEPEKTPADRPRVIKSGTDKSKLET